MQNSCGWRGCITTNVTLSVILFRRICRKGASTARPGTLWRPDTRLFNSLQTTEKIACSVLLCRPARLPHETRILISVRWHDMDDVLFSGKEKFINQTKDYSQGWTGEEYQVGTSDWKNCQTSRSATSEHLPAFFGMLGYPHPYCFKLVL